MLSFLKLFRSFRHAGRGIIGTLKTEQNFRIHCVLGVCVVIIALFFRVSALEFSIIILSIAILLALEILNTLFEKVIDILKPRVHHYVAEIKDIAAGGVFIAACACAATVILVFTPYIIKMARNLSAY